MAIFSGILRIYLAVGQNFDHFSLNFEISKFCPLKVNPKDAYGTFPHFVTISQVLWKLDNSANIARQTYRLCLSATVICNPPSSPSKFGLPPIAPGHRQPPSLHKCVMSVDEVTKLRLRANFLSL